MSRTIPRQAVRRHRTGMTATSLLRILLVGALMAASACGSRTTAARSASPAPGHAIGATTPPAAPTPTEPLFVTLESSTGDGFSTAPDTIAIIGLDGRARARARFTPHSIPFVGTALMAVVPPVAHVTAGRAYFIDGEGTVRSLGFAGELREETRFPVTGAQQEASFAVSPDGRHLVGAVVTLPAVPSQRPPQLAGQFSMDVMTADAGGLAVVTHRESWTDVRAHGGGAQLLAWDPTGPVASYPAPLGGAGGGFETLSGGPLVHLTDGRPGSRLQVSDRCFVKDLLADGRYVCTPAEGAIEVHAASGALLWQRVHTPGEDHFSCALSPDGDRVAAYPGSQVVDRDGNVVDLASSFDQLGWLDAETVIGHTGPAAELAYVRLREPATVVDLGFRGAFVGRL
jgi:hypothetical protein